MIGNLSKIDVRTISGGFFIFCQYVLFACEDESLKFFSHKFIISVTPVDRPQEHEKNETFPGSEGFIHEEKIGHPVLA